MIKIVFILFFIITILTASEAEKKALIFNKLVKTITQKSAPNVYLHSNIKEIILYPNSMNIVYNCDKADVVIVSTLKDIPKSCSGKIFFGTKYKHLKDARIVGAFFWQKGRPNILFYKKRLDKCGISLDEDFNKYIENE